MPLTARACDRCDSNDLESVWRYTANARTSGQTYEWEVHNVVCRNCGFAFVSPAPAEADLELYYAESYGTFEGQRIDYSIEKRLMVIRKHACRTGAECFVDIGSNDSVQFLAALTPYFKRIETVELNHHCQRTYGCLEELPTAYGDMLSAYFVLEHIVKPKEFLLTCAEALKIPGILILEVPHLYQYPQDPAGLLLHEHVNHFSPASLATIAARCGLELIDISLASCSRSFGFVAVFQKTDVAAVLKVAPDPVERIHARACMGEGRKVIEMFQARIKQVRKRIDSMAVGENQTIIVWAANAICAMLLDGYQPPPWVIVVDSDPAKADYFQSSGIQVLQPHKVQEQIGRANLLIVNSRLNFDDIHQWIFQNTARRFTREETVILDYC